MPYLSCQKTPVNLTASQYKKWWESQDERLRFRAEEIYKTKVETLLKGWGTAEKMAKRIAVDAIKNENIILSNANEDNKAVVDLVNEQGLEFKHLTFEYYLLLEATKSDFGKNLPREQEQIIRQFQYENFCKNHPFLQNSATPRDSSLVDTYGDMLKKVEDFLTKICKFTLRAVIMFNGHGSEGGLALEEEKDPIPLDTVISDIRKIRVKLEKLGCVFPLQIMVIFCQCYGHMHDEVDGNGMSAIHFTDEGEQVTFTSFKCDDHKRVSSAHHLNMDIYAEDMKEEFDQNGGKIKLSTPLAHYMYQIESPFEFMNKHCADSVDIHCADSVDIHGADSKTESPTSPKIHTQCTDQGCEPYLGALASTFDRQNSYGISALFEAESHSNSFPVDIKQNLCASIGNAGVFSFETQTTEGLEMECASTEHYVSMEASAIMTQSDSEEYIYSAGSVDECRMQTYNHDNIDNKCPLNLNLERDVLADEQQALTLGIDLREDEMQTNVNSDPDINIKQDKTSKKGHVNLQWINVPFWINLWNNISADTPKLTFK